jgi:predicted RNase H-like HicB family nuclease
MAEVHPLQIETEREDDGRWLAAVPALPGVMAYAVTPEEAARKARALALRILADMIENDEALPEPVKSLFAP